MPVKRLLRWLSSQMASIGNEGQLIDPSIDRYLVCLSSCIPDRYIIEPLARIFCILWFRTLLVLSNQPSTGIRL